MMAKWRLESTKETKEKIERLRENDEDNFKLRNGAFVWDRMAWVPEGTDDEVLALKDEHAIEGNLEGHGERRIEEGIYGYDGQLLDDESSLDNDETIDIPEHIKVEYERLRKEYAVEMQEDSGYEFLMQLGTDVKELEERLKEDRKERLKREEQLRRATEEKAEQEREEQERKELEEKARQEREEQARKELEEKARQEREEQERKELEEKARQEREEQERKELEEKARQEREEQARLRQEAIARERMEAEQEKIRQRAELEIFMEELRQRAEQEQLKREERKRNPYKAIAEDMLTLSTLQNADAIREIQVEMCHTALSQLEEECKLAMHNANKNMDEKYRGDLSECFHTFVDRNLEAFYEKLRAKDTWEKDDILSAIRTTVLDDEVMLWKSSGVVSFDNPILKEFSVKDMKYILLKYNFNTYKDFSDFKRQYASFCELIREGSSVYLNHNDELRAFFEQTFENTTDYEAILQDEEQLRSLYQNGAIGFLDILDKVEKKQDGHNKQEKNDTLTQKIWNGFNEQDPTEAVSSISNAQEQTEAVGSVSNAQEQTEVIDSIPNAQKQIEADNLVIMDGNGNLEKGEQEMFQDEFVKTNSEDELESDNTPYNDGLKPSIEGYENSIPEHLKEGWQMKSVEEMEIEAGLRRREDDRGINNENRWMNRFENWHKQSDMIPTVERYSIMKNIVQTMRDAMRLRNDFNRTQQENER